jgi:AcrR family transcriptional regulator
MAKAKRRSSASGDETKAKIVDATLQTLQDEGIVGASARAIARAGDFNQALIFYHFGSVDEAIVAAIGELSRRRLERYRKPLLEVDNLTDLISVARELYENDRASGEITILAQAFAGASRDDEMGPAMYDHIADWNSLIEEVVKKAVAASPLGDSALAAAVPMREIAIAISALFLGIELLGQLDPGRANTDQMFTSIAAMAQLAESMLKLDWSVPPLKL